MGNSNLKAPGTLVIDTAVDGGQRIIPGVTPLKRLHYFDGKFLRAPDLNLEQAALLSQVRFSNRAGGAGVVHGLACSVGDGKLGIGAGLAVDATGRLLYLPADAEIELAPLIEDAAARGAVGTMPAATGGFADCVPAKADGDGGPAVAAGGYYLIVALHAEAFCGSEEVYGRLCETACVGDSQRPYVTEGILVQAWPVSLTLPGSGIALGPVHERSRAASAWFRAHPGEWGSLISAAGLASEIWCQAARLSTKQGVPLALIAYEAGSVRFLDNWIARRERIETAPRWYWAKRMAMRPWAVYLAEVLQFQCQLPGALTHTAGGGEPGAGPCDPEHALIARAVETISRLAEDCGIDGSVVETFLADAQALLPAAGGEGSSGGARLIDGGIVELPSAGWLPVDPASQRTVNDQVAAMLGAGVDLRFCVVRPDFVPHAFEEAQHMERVSLLHGLDHPDELEEVDILVPNGIVEELVREAPGTGYVMTLDVIEGDRETAEVNAIEPTGQPIGEVSAAAARRTSSTAGMRVLNVTGLRSGGGSTPSDRVAAARHDREAYVQGGYRIPGSSGRLGAAIAAPKTGLPEAGEADLSGAARDEIDNSGGFGLRLAGQTAALILTQIAPLTTSYRHFLAVPARARGTVEATEAGMRGEAEARPGRSDARSDANHQLSIWLDFHVAADPYTLADGERARVDLHVVWLQIDDPDAANDPSRLSEVKLFGHLRRTRRFQSGGLDTISGELEVDGTVYEPDNEPPRESLRFAGKLRIDRGGDPERIILTFDMAEAYPSDFVGTTLVLERRWNSGEASTYALAWNRIDANGERQTLDLAAGTLVVDPDVGNPGHQMHSAAISALTRVGHELDAPSFADVSAAALFPPPLVVADELLVRAAEDWVLFHRRRTKVCAHERPGVEPLSERVYHVYRIAAPSEDDIGRIVEALRLDLASELEAYGPASIVHAEFAPAVQTLRTARDEIFANWQIGLREGAEVHYAAIASLGEAYDEGPQLALARLANLLGVIAPASPVDQAQLEHLTTFPSALGGGSIDGVIALVTLVPAEVETTCHDVYIFTDGDPDTVLFEELARTDHNRVLERWGAEPLIEGVEFFTGSVGFADRSLPGQIRQAWDDSWSGSTVYGAGVVTLDIGPNDPIPPERAEQGLVIGQATGTAVPATFEVVRGSGERTPCRTLTVLFVDRAHGTATEVHPVFVTGDRRGDETLERYRQRRLEYLREGGWADEFAGDGWTDPFSGNQWLELGRPGFAGESPASGALDPVIERATKLGLIGPEAPDNPQILAYSLVAQGRVEADSNAQARGEAQTKQVLLALGIDSTLTQVLVSQPDLPDGVAAMTLLVSLIAASDITDAIGAPSSMIEVATPPEGLVVAGTEPLTFDASAGVVRDAAYAATVSRLRASGEPIRAIEVLAEGSVPPDAPDPRTESLLAALKRDGVAASDTVVRRREATAAERERLGAAPVRARGALVFRR